MLHGAEYSLSVQFVLELTNRTYKYLSIILLEAFVQGFPGLDLNVPSKIQDKKKFIYEIDEALTRVSIIIKYRAASISVFWTG